MQLPSLGIIELFLMLHSLRHWIEPNPIISDTTDIKPSYAWFYPCPEKIIILGKPGDDVLNIGFNSFKNPQSPSKPKRNIKGSGHEWLEYIQPFVF